jgi:hypothetical protein
MKAITIHVSEPVYREFQSLARRLDRTASELIRESMEQYLRQRSKEKRRSLLDIQPLSLGIRKSWKSRQDLLEGMLDDIRA